VRNDELCWNELSRVLAAGSFDSGARRRQRGLSRAFALD
jgi:hypothetical protein